MKPLILFLVFTCASLRGAESFHIAAAADLVYCLQALNKAFGKEAPGVEVKVTTGSSGTFFAQISNGAPFDVYLSADLVYPRRLIEARQAVADSLTMYAIGRIVLWTTRGDLDLSRGLGVVNDPKVKRFAIGNPLHAPYGRAAQEALQSVKLWEAVGPKLVLGENIAQTAQFVETGSADAGIIALSLVRAPVLKGRGRYVEISADQHDRLEQGAVLTNHGANNPAAKRYLAFLKSPDARRIFDDYGFILP